MFQLLKEFKIGRPQIIAGLILLAFLAQCLWVASRRKLSDLEYHYIATGISSSSSSSSANSSSVSARLIETDSPLTSWVAALPVRTINVVRKFAMPSISEALAVPRPELLRLPFVFFGVWLGGALWWVARRLFDDAGGYVALVLYCTSPAMIKISSNIGPEIILAWSGLGLIYTAIGVAHTLYAPPKKWVPRIGILGLAIGFALATTWWSFTLVLLASAYMLYLAPGCRKKALTVLAGSTVIGCMVWTAVYLLTGSFGIGVNKLAQASLFNAARNLLFALSPDTDGYVLVGLFIVAFTTYGSWARTRYFGNTAPLLTAFSAVFLFTLAPVIRLWDATLSLSFIFIFIGGIAADLLETRFRRPLMAILAACLLLRTVLTVVALNGWVQNLM